MRCDCMRVCVLVLHSLLQCAQCVRCVSVQAVVVVVVVTGATTNFMGHVHVLYVISRPRWRLPQSNKINEEIVFH